MLKVKNVMTTPVFCLRETDTLRSARTMMDMQRIRHIPIVGADRTFIGLVTHRDILAATISQLAGVDAVTQDEIDSGIPIREIMRTDVRTTAPEADLKEAATILLNHKYGCLPVADKGKLVGIITEADFLRLTISLLEALETGEKP